jgi:hypothetical protein
MEGSRMLLHETSSETSTAHTRGLLALVTDSDIEMCVSALRTQIDDDAHLAHLDRRSFETQVRLHLPSLPRSVLSSEDYIGAYQTIRPIVLIRAAQIRQELELAELRANASLLLPKKYAVKRTLALEAPDGSKLALQFKQVPASIGHVYQSRLHYLRSTRGDTRFHFGMFLPGADYPLTYVALSPCDRPYMADSLIAARLESRLDECIVLTRMYGLPGVPANLISLTLKHAIRVLRQKAHVKLLLTAYNPLLGFTGAAFRASGFRPFALAPVSYKYNARGEFITRRSARNTSSLTGSPPNVLLVRGIDRNSQKAIIGNITMTRISEKNYDANSRRANQLPEVDSNSWLALLLGYRKLLEGAWSRSTIHPSYLGQVTEPIDPKGQCGVSSVWLARQLRTDFGVEATYCYGDLEFADPTRKPVHHHCWIEVGEEDDASRIVIDLTCDQAESVSEPVLSAEHTKLVERGMKYIARTRLSLDEIPLDRVWHRFNVLDDAMDGSILRRKTG